MFSARCFPLVGCSLLLVVGCSKPSPEEQKKKEAELTNALASAMGSALAAPSAAGAGGAAAKPGEFVGSCLDNESKICNEYSGALPLGAADSCKMMNGVFSATNHCPEKMGNSPLTGKCTVKAEGDERVKTTHAYQVDGTTAKATAESAKAMCEIQSGTFLAVAAPAAAGKAAAAPAAAKPAAAAATTKKK